MGDDAVAEGRPHLCLLVSPRLGALDEAAVIEVFLTSLAANPGDTRVRLWREASFLRVERRTPIPTPSGKILHLVARPTSQPSRSL